ncbi:MAG: hypothetical protein ACYSOT_09905 [Planctomycetota bacterium]
MLPLQIITICKKTEDTVLETNFGGKAKILVYCIKKAALLLQSGW